MVNELDIHQVLVNGKPHWRFPGGKTLPVVAGGSDAGPGLLNQPPGTQQLPGQQAPIVLPLLQQQAPPNYDPSDPRVQAAIEAARKEEKDKLYAEIQKERERAAALEAKEQERAEAAEKARKEAEEIARKQQEEELSAKDLIAKRDQEWNQRFEEQERARKNLEAALSLERQFSELRVYRQQIAAANAENILPELMEYLTGPTGDRLTTKEEIDAECQRLVSISSSVLQNVRGQADAGLRQMPGATPMSGQPGFDPHAALGSADNIDPSQVDWSQVSMAQYQALRHKLPTGRPGRSGEGVGIFG